MRKLLLVLVSGALALCGAALDQKDVRYGTADETALLMDLHVPDGPGPFPAAILVHGGGFDGGSKSTNVKPLFGPLQDAGFAWFSIDYRLAPAAKFPQALADVNSAITWVKAHAGTYHVDASRLALIGESAGGLLVNYAGTHDTPETKVAAVVDFYGPSDYGKLAELRRSNPERFDINNISQHAAHGGGIHFFEVDELNEAGLAKLHSLAPVAGVHRGMPPFLIIHGTADDQVAFEQSPSFCEAIRGIGSDCELIKIEGGGHGMSKWRAPEMQHWKTEMIAWLQKTWGMKATAP